MGYDFVPATPTINPGVDASPLMTWGEIDGAPLRLDATPAIASTPSFRMPEPPKREKIAHGLVQRASEVRILACRICFS